MAKLAEQASGLAAWLRQDIFQLNFYRAHLIYFVITIMVSSAIFWASNTDGFKVPYIDALFMCATAMTNCGLSTVDLSQINAYQQTILFVLMALGDLSIASISVVWIRRYFFGKKIHHLLKHSKAARRMAKDIEEQRYRKKSRLDERTVSAKSTALTTKQNGYTEPGRRLRPHPAERTTSKPAIQRLPRTQSGYGGLPSPWETRTFRRLLRLPLILFKKDHTPDHKYLSFPPDLDTRGRLRNLSSDQLEELGGVEYRALGVLTWLLPTYTMLWLSLSWIVLLPYTTRPSTESIIRNSQAGNTNPRWWAFFAGLSAYSNTGLSLLDQNMIPFSHDYLILIITGAIVLGGNTFYPIFLRMFIWGLTKVVPKNSQLLHSLMFLLHHPRRCFLFLFPKKSTWYLFGIQFVIFMLIWLAFEILNIGYAPIMSEISDPAQRTMDGLFQSVGVRSSGFYITNQSNLSPACQIYFMVNMYFSAIPFIVSLRSTNIYEEKSIGTDSNQHTGSDSESGFDDGDDDDDHSTDANSKKSRGQQNRKGRGPNIRTHLQNQLAYDLWWIILAVFLVTIIERSGLAGPESEYNIFSVIFEVISAYGTIGLSLGVPGANTSFCGVWAVLSKLILITVMLRGRHRILPLAVDRAVLLPGQELMDRLDREDTLRYSTNSRSVSWRQQEKQVSTEDKNEQVEHHEGRILEKMEQHGTESASHTDVSSSESSSANSKKLLNKDKDKDKDQDL